MSPTCQPIKRLDLLSRSHASMFRALLCPFHLYLFLTFASVSFATVPPQRLAALATSNNISRFVQHFRRRFPPVRETPKTPPQNLAHALSAHASKRDLRSITPSRTPLNDGSRGILASVLVQSTPLQVSSRQSGLNFDTCESDSECARGRTCLELQGSDIVSCSSGSDCVCGTANVVLICASHSDCDDGESCVETGPNLDLLCVSDTARSTSGGDDSSSAGSFSSGSGLNGERCTKDSDCAAPRQCFDAQALLQSNAIPCSSGRTCLCTSTDPGAVLCNSGSDCEDGESCMTIEEVGVCISDEAVCIGSDSLTHLAKEELIFEHDALAHVLCDANESCATPGHMVVYKGEALMMKSYCELVGCTRKVKRVNSPKYVRRLTVPSQTRDLVFTAFAARFGTVVEEGVLSVAVRVGF